MVDRTMKPQPMIAVKDVEASSRWYQQLLGLASAHGGDEYERLTFHDELVMQIHRWSVHEHEHLGDPDQPPFGNGVLLWFETGEFDETIKRATRLEAKILEQPFINPNANHRECWLRDLDGYVVVVASHYGDTGEL